MRMNFLNTKKNEPVLSEFGHFTFPIRLVEVGGSKLDNALSVAEISRLSSHMCSLQSELPAFFSKKLKIPSTRSAKT